MLSRNMQRKLKTRKWKVKMGENMKILICDNHLDFIDKIRADIEKKLKSEEMAYQIYVKDHDFMQIDHIYDVIFVNVDLGKDSGIEVARKIKKLMPKVIVVFVSADSNAVFETLSVGIFQFIRQDHYQHDITRCMDDMMTYLKNHLQYVLLDIKGRKTKIYYSNIKYILSIGHEVTIYGYDCEICFRATLSKALDMIHCRDLIQIQRGIAVHMNYIEDMKKWQIKGEDGIFTIGRKYQKLFLEKYENYIRAKRTQSS